MRRIGKDGSRWINNDPYLLSPFKGIITEEMLAAIRELLKETGNA